MPLQTAFPTEPSVGTAAEPLTIAARICGKCRVFLGLAFWRGRDAHPANPAAGIHATSEPNVTTCETTTVCDECLEAQAREADAIRCPECGELDCEGGEQECAEKRRARRRERALDYSDREELDPYRLRADLEEVGGL